MFQSEFGSAKCNECVRGSYCPKTGCTRCEACEAGNESLNQGQSYCTLCRPGYYKPVSSYENCRECKNGWYSLSNGSLTCNTCPQGYYCDCKSCEPKLCPPDSICPEGSLNYTKCSSPFYYVKNLNDLTCTETLQFYLVIFGSASGILILITIALVTFKKRTPAEDTTSAERKKLLKDTPDIFYHGY